MIKYKLATSEIKKPTNSTTIKQESVTDKTRFRPETANIRDKALAIIQSGQGRTGIYDNTATQSIDMETAQALSYARGMGRDITEIEQAKRAIKASIEHSKMIDEKNIKEAKKTAQNEDMNKKLKEIAENTKKEDKK